MIERYRRLLGFKEGSNPTDLELIQAQERLSTAPALEGVELKRMGDRLEVSLKERPVFSLLPVPIPYLWEVALAGSAEQWRIGPTYWLANAEAGYIWDAMRIEALQGGASQHEANYRYGFASLGSMFWPDITGLLRFEAYGADIQGDLAGSYDPTALARGWSFTMGPELRFDQVDSNFFPREGLRARAGANFGPVLLGNQTDFARYQAEVQRYFPIGEGAVLVTGLTGGFGRGSLPWHEKLQAGGITNFRGYAGRRFMGDQLLVGTLEARKRLVEDLKVPLLSDFWLSKLGLTGGLFLDVGRAWDSKLSVPFPQDARVGVGGFLGVSLGNWNASRIEVAFGNEGPSVGLTMGLPFDW